MDPFIRILHLEDDPMDAELVQAKLGEAGLACRITRVQARDEFEQALEQEVFDIILADFRLPSYDGISALRATLARRPEVPFLFVSGTMGEEAAIEALTQGATDYVLKHNLSRLASAVQRALQEAENRWIRKKAEEALAQSEAKMRCILDSVDEGFLIIDRGYRILSANKAFCCQNDLQEEQVIGNLCHEVTHRAARPCIEHGEDCPVKWTFETGEIHTASHVHESAAGTRRYLEIKSYPVLDESGTITSVIETVSDVTEKRKLQEQLAQSQKLESVARLAGGVAHDFNNMLGVILGLAELAMGQLNPSHPVFSDLQEICQAADRSAALTRQLLAFARKQTVVPKVLDLNETVEGMLNMLRPLIGEDIDLVWRPGNGLWPVKMDPSQLDQILANLCVNARDAIAKVGRVVIETGVLTIGPDVAIRNPEPIPGEYVSLTVIDDGCGMDSDTMSKIFEPFFTTKAVGQGTGLGLATVYGIVKQNNGFIDVSSEPERGTTFKIYLPCHADASAVPGMQHAVPASGGHETILLVEDEPMMLNMAKLMLEKLGYRVISASTPSQAMNRVKAHDGKIHLLLMDVIMPEMNGPDLAKQIASLYPESSCLFMSGYSGDAIAHRGVLDQNVHFIQKPFSLRDLAAKVREVLDAV